ncbi:hypothetical protein C1H46_038474 [Malus baccata]|uniref:DNA replication complex GINS protein PSF3 N-terminal domain-containing protein n=1 Tax=Malus baccata TaxID=106549 RepID=A0A540KP77_MALBA|nr:hypothetical protein C1H46_038474 [Malus baccata]
MANYYDIDDIIMEQQLVPVVFQKAVNGVEIDPSAETDYVEAGSKVELPLWLAYELHLKQVVKMKVPACFNHRTKLELGADGAAVDLRSRCLYFYEFGCKIAPLGLRKWYMTRTPMDKLVFTVTCHDLVLRQSERESNSASNPKPSSSTTISPPVLHPSSVEPSPSPSSVESSPIPPPTSLLRLIRRRPHTHPHSQRI